MFPLTKPTLPLKLRVSCAATPLLYCDRSTQDLLVLIQRKLVSLTLACRTQSIMMKKTQRLTFYTLITLWMLCTIVLNLRPAFVMLDQIYIYIYKCVNTCECVHMHVVCGCMCDDVQRCVWWNLHHTNSERLKYGLCQTLRRAATHKRALVHLGPQEVKAEQRGMTFHPGT